MELRLRWRSVAIIRRRLALLLKMLLWWRVRLGRRILLRRGVAISWHRLALW